MKIHHIAIWTRDLEKMKDFYQKYFNMYCGDKYHNHRKGFSSYFLSFENSETKIELMHNENIAAIFGDKGGQEGFTHIAISVGSTENVKNLTEKLRRDRIKIASEARTTGDGYFESVVLDPEGNLIEITV